MKTTALASLLLTAGALTILPACNTLPAPQVRAERLEADMRTLITEARDKVFPALVNIRVISISYWDGKENKSSSQGSGTIITPQGHIVTNAHVIDRGTKFKCTLSDKTEVDADLIGEDLLTDLAVIKLRLDQLPKDYRIATAEWGDSDKLVVGDTVMAMGSPLSLSRTVTLGIVSNNERVFANTWTNDRETQDLEIDGASTGIFTRWIQHDALINPGNSGGPLVNLRGQIIGINTRGGAGIGYASPSSLARDVSGKLIANGEVVRSTIGMSLKPIEKTGLTEGVLVNSVSDNPPGPAAKAGIKAGDAITRINGQPVTVKFVEEVPPLLRMMADLPVGSQIAVEYLRKGQRSNATITTEKMLPERGDETALRGWGLSVSEITEKYARERRLKSRAGVLVTSVRSGSPAALSEPAIWGGDIITHVAGEPVTGVRGFVEMYKKIMKGPEQKDQIPEFLLVRFDRHGKDTVTVVKPRPVPEPDPSREIPKPWIGVSVQPVLKDLAKQLGQEGQQGFRIARVYPRTLAANSELKVGDVIVALNGEKIRANTIQDEGLFQRKIRQLPSSLKEATLSVLRDGQPVDVKVSLERTRIGSQEARKDDNKDFELSVRELTFFDRDENDWDESINGVLVEGAEQTGWAGQGGIGGGDLIIRIDDTDIPDIDTYRKVIADITKRQPERVVFVVLRGVNTSFKFVEPEWKPTVGEQHK